MSRLKSDTIWVVKGSEFYNRSIKSCLKDNNAKMCSRYEDRKSVVSEKFMRNIKNIIYKYVSLTLKSIYVDKFEHIVDKYSNKNRNEDCLCKVGDIYFDIVNNNKDPKFKHGDYFITSIIKTFLQIATLQIGLKNFL